MLGLALQPILGNFFAGREKTSPRWLGAFGWVNDRAMRSETDEIIERLQVNLPGADAEIGMMSGGQRQAVACARAIACLPSANWP